MSFFYQWTHGITFLRFTAALTGLPVLIAESDICTEHPADVDDENITETGFVPTGPEESTRMSSAIALFNVSRILNRVLEELYPSPAGYKISLSAVHSLAEELDDWQKKLPDHLRLEFAQDKPSTNITGSRSPLLVCTSATLLWDYLSDKPSVNRLLFHPHTYSSTGGLLRKT